MQSVNKPKIGIRPIIDGRKYLRAGLEEQTMSMARAAADLIESSLRYLDGSPAECVISPTSIGGGEEAARCDEFFRTQNVTATLSVTPCWCYGSETMDLNPSTIKAVWGFNGTERPGAVYLAAVMAAHAQRGLPAFSIYSRHVQDMHDRSIPADAAEKILRFARCALAAGQMQGKSYVNIGGVSMGIMGSFCDPAFFQKYLGIRAEWVDMTEVLRRIDRGIYDREEYARALEFVKTRCLQGEDRNPVELRFTAAQKDEQWEAMVKMALIARDILFGNEKLAALGYPEEALGKNAIAGGFQGQRMWSDWQPIGDFTESILASTFDWNGPKPPVAFATENDTLNAVSMLFGNLLTGGASVFADVRTHWSPESVERVTGWKPEGLASGGFIHLINSGAAALDGTGRSLNAQGQGCMKPWWEMTELDRSACLSAVRWTPADRGYFPGGGYSCQYETSAEMPVTMIRCNLIDGLGPVLQFVEGHTVVLPDKVDKILYTRTDPTWPSTWFAPRTGSGAARDGYSVMSSWGSNHAAFCYGHVGADLATLASMLRIPVSLHNLSDEHLFRPHCWGAFGTQGLEAADYAACKAYGPLYR